MSSGSYKASPLYSEIEILKIVLNILRLTCKFCFREKSFVYFLWYSIIKDQLHSKETALLNLPVLAHFLKPLSLILWCRHYYNLFYFLLFPIQVDDFFFQGPKHFHKCFWQLKKYHQHRYETALTSTIYCPLNRLFFYGLMKNNKLHTFLIFC